MLKAKSINTLFCNNLNKRLFSHLSKVKSLVHDASHNENPKIDPFIISSSSGFLPRKDPVVNLPKEFKQISDIADKMRWYQPDGSAGYLQKGTLGDVIEKELEQIDVDKVKFNDTLDVLAVYRDYSFLNNAYLLENPHHNYLKTKKYGLGREIVPKQLAVPFKKLSDMLDLKPYLEYNGAYGPNNWKRIDKTKGLTMENIETIRTFTDIPSEHGFIKVHITIDNHSGHLIRSGLNALQAAKDNNRKDFNKSLLGMKSALELMNYELKKMFLASRPNDYGMFRTFLMGIGDQPMFPKGVVYEGCYDNKPQFFRGETGANDSLIPFADNITQVTEILPENELTRILRDFRRYRPKSHNVFLDECELAAKEVGVREFARKDSLSLFHFVEVLDEIRAFRSTHWTLTYMFIISLTDHPKATGGSPILTWLPNQLNSVVGYIRDNTKLINEADLPSELVYKKRQIEQRE